MYFASLEELKNIIPISNGIWNKEYLIWSSNAKFEKYIDSFFEEYSDNEELAELLFSYLLDDNYDGSDCQMGAAYYIAKLDKEILKSKKDLLLQAQENDVDWKRPFPANEHLEWI